MTDSLGILTKVTDAGSLYAKYENKILFIPSLTNIICLFTSNLSFIYTYRTYPQWDSCVVSWLVYDYYFSLTRFTPFKHLKKVHWCSQADRRWRDRLLFQIHFLENSSISATFLFAKLLKLVTTDRMYQIHQQSITFFSLSAIPSSLTFFSSLSAGSAKSLSSTGSPFFLPSH